MKQVNKLLLYKIVFSLTAILVVITSTIFAQAYVNYNQLSGQQINSKTNTITTAVPFLMITPDARASGMGDAGVASSTDVNSIHWNPAKLAFADKKFSIGVSWTPWLRALVPDINLLYLSHFYKTKKCGTFGGSFRYFSMGDITFTNINGQTIGNFRPFEFAVDIAYALKLSKTFSTGIALRYISSELTGGTFVGGSATKPGRAVAVDISALWKKENMELFADKKATTSIGLNISNLGSKVTYSDRGGRGSDDFLPINLRLGGAFTFNFNDNHSITIEVDANKLLVPTPPIYDTASLRSVYPVILSGKDPNRGVIAGMLGSFNDAPGGRTEELQEISYATGLEYWYKKIVAIRAGYFYENPYKGNRHYCTIGAGVRFYFIGLDVSYLIVSYKQRNPLEDTFRVTLSLNFNGRKPKDAEKVD